MVWEQVLSGGMKGAGFLKGMMGARRAASMASFLTGEVLVELLVVVGGIGGFAKKWLKPIQQNESFIV